MSADTKTLADKVLEYVEADASHLTDQLITAAECAKTVVDLSTANNPKDMAVAMNSSMTGDVSVFERGLALGIMVALRAVGSQP